MKGDAASVPARRLARNFSWLSFQELIIRLLGLATAVYLARVLEPAVYGELGLAIAIVSFAGVFIRAGTGSRGIRMTARDPGAVPEIFAEITGLRILVTTLMIVLLLLSAPWLEQVFKVSSTLLVLCSLVLLRSGLTVAWAFRGLDRMHVTALAEIAERGLILAGLLLFVKGLGNDVLWVPVVELVAAMAIVILLYRKLAGLYGPMRPKFGLRAWRGILGESIPLSIASLLNTFYLSGGVLLLGWMADTESAAIFLVAQKVMLTLAMLLVISHAAAFPTISRFVRDNTGAALELAARILRYFLVVIVPAFLLVAFHAALVLDLLFGNEYRQSAPVLAILLVVIPFTAVSNSARVLLMAVPRPMAVLGARAGGAVILLSLSFWLIPERGAQGAAIALAAAEIISSILMLAAIKRATGALPLDMRCLAPVLAGLVSAAAYLGLASWPMAARIAVAAAVYAGLVFLLKGLTVSELRAFKDLFLPGAPGAETKVKP